MAPSPLVGIKPMMANRAVLTEIKADINLGCFAKDTCGAWRESTGMKVLALNSFIPELLEGVTQEQTPSATENSLNPYPK